MFGGVDVLFSSVLKSVRWAGNIKAERGVPAQLPGPAAPLQHSDCDPSLRVCVYFYSLCTHSQRCFCSPPLFFFFFLSIPPPCVSYRAEPQIPNIALGLFGLSPSLSLLFIYFLPYTSPYHIYSSPFFFLLFIYLLQVFHFEINMILLKSLVQCERSRGSFEVRILNMLNSKDVLNIWNHWMDVKCLNLFF